MSSVNEVVITSEALTIAIGAGLIAASSGLFLAWRITQQNINSLKRVSRASSKAWWQKTYLDFIVIGLSAYALYTLFTQDGIDAAESPFANPLTFVAPTLFALGLTLLFLRLLPIVLTILARVIGVTSNIPLLMALRELTRNIGRYRGTLIMTAFTLSLVGFTASMASTLDRSLLDVVRYQVGAELVVVTVPDAQTEQSQDETTGETSEEVTGFNAPPVLQLLELDEVDYISRVGLYDARLSVTGRRLTGLAIGIDREGLGGVTFMRDDFTQESLGSMLNELADNRTGIIISQQTAEEYGIAIGQEVRYEVQALGEWQTEIRATVVGYIEYFPTIDPSNYEFFLLTSIQPIFEVAGTPLPFNVWLNLNENATLEDVQNAAAKYFSLDNSRIVITGKGIDVIDNLEKSGYPIKYFDKNGNQTEKPEMTIPIPEGVTASTVIDKYITAIGGEDKLMSIKSIVMTSTAKVQGMEITLVTKAAAPNKTSTVVSGMGRVFSKMVFDGETGYQEAQGRKKDMTADEITEAKAKNVITEELAYKNGKLLRIEPLDGKKAYVIKYNDKEIFFDVKTGLKLKEVKTVKAGGKEMSIPTVYSNYKEVKGMKLPHTIGQKMGPMDMKFEVKDIKINEGVTDADFK